MNINPEQTTETSLQEESTRTRIIDETWKKLIWTLMVSDIESVINNLNDLSNISDYEDENEILNEIIDNLVKTIIHELKDWVVDEYLTTVIIKICNLKCFKKFYRENPKRLLLRFISSRIEKVNFKKIKEDWWVVFSMIQTKRWIIEPTMKSIHENIEKCDYFTAILEAYLLVTVLDNKNSEILKWTIKMIKHFVEENIIYSHQYTERLDSKEWEAIDNTTIKNIYAEIEAII